MKSLLGKLAGILLIVAGVLGLILSAAGIYAMAQVEKSMTGALTGGMQFLDRTLAATGDGFVVVQDSLVRAGDTVSALQTTTAGVADTLDKTIPTIDTLNTVISQELPDTVRATQQSLESAGAAAGLVDEALGVITSLPLLNQTRYAPAAPMGESFVAVGESLADLPDTLEATNSQLSATSDSLRSVQGQITGLATGIGELNRSLEDAGGVVSQYQGLVNDMRGQVGLIQTNIGGWIRYLRLGVSLVLIWLGIAQIALITQGWELIQRSRRTTTPAV